MKDDVISRQAAIKAIEQMQLPIMRSDFFHEQFIFQGLSEALAAIMKLPSVQPRKGKWLKAYGDHEAFGIRPFYRYCSECNEATVFPYNFCPNCGADMRGSEQG